MVRRLFLGAVLALGVRAPAFAETILSYDFVWTVSSEFARFDRSWSPTEPLGANASGRSALSLSRNADSLVLTWGGEPGPGRAEFVPGPSGGLTDELLFPTGLEALGPLQQRPLGSYLSDGDPFAPERFSLALYDGFDCSRSPRLGCDYQWSSVLLGQGRRTSLQAAEPTVGALVGLGLLLAGRLSTPRRPHAARGAEASARI